MMDDSLPITNDDTQMQTEISWLPFEKPETQQVNEDTLEKNLDDISLQKIQSEEPQFKSEDVLDHLPSLRTLTNQRTELQLPSWNALWNVEPLSLILEALENAWLNDQYIAEVIKEGIESAVFQGPKGEILRDRNNINKLIDKYFKVKKIYKQDINILVVNKFNNPEQLY